RTIYVPNNIREILLKDNVYFKSFSSNTNNEQKNTIEYELIIYSYNLTFDHISKVIMDITSEYKMNEKYKLQNQHKIFTVVREKDRDATYSFSTISTDFKSNKRFDNIFFE